MSLSLTPEATYTFKSVKEIHIDAKRNISLIYQIVRCQKK